MTQRYPAVKRSSREHWPELLHVDFVFRGSLGEEFRGRTAFVEYVRSIRGLWLTVGATLLSVLPRPTRPSF